MNDNSVVIIGGGIAGLTCAKYLTDAGKSFILLEGSEALGGRMKTDTVETFKLDRGFQVLLTNYPEVRKVLNYNHLHLKNFESGAMIRMNKGFMTLENPFRKPSAYFSMLFSSVGSLSDKLKIRKLVNELSNQNDDFLLQQPATDTLRFLKDYGFSQQIIHNFFTPFFGGVFLEDELQTSSSFFQFIFKQFFKGDAALPAEGMQMVSEQIAEMIPAGRIRKNAVVKGFEGNQIFLESGEVITTDKIILATNPTQADDFLGIETPRHYLTTTCTYFSAEVSPMKGKRFLLLNPNRKSMVHNVCVPSDFSTKYAPAGKALISVSTHGLQKLDEKTHVNRIKRELYEWFGASVNVWKHLRTYHVKEALVKYPPNATWQDFKLNENLYRCGDYLTYPSLNAAMQSGRKVAEMIVG